MQNLLTQNKKIKFFIEDPTLELFKIVQIISFYQTISNSDQTVWDVNLLQFLQKSMQSCLLADNHYLQNYYKILTDDRYLHEPCKIKADIRLSSSRVLLDWCYLCRQFRYSMELISKKLKKPFL